MPRKPPCLPAERSVGFRPKFPAPPSGSAKMIRQTTAPNKMIVPPQRRYWPPSGVAKILALRFYHLACCCRQFSCLLARELVLFFLQHTKGKQVSRNEDEEVSGNEDEEVSGNEDGEVSRNEDEEYKDDGGNQDEDDDGGHRDEDKQTKGKKKKCNIGSHCEPNSIIKAVDALSDSAKSVVRASGFGAFLRMDITTLYSIDTIMYLMNNCDVSSDGESFTVVVSEDNQIEVTPEFVKECFGIPDGDKSLEDHWGNEYNKFWQRMKDLGYAVTAKVNSRGKIQENKKLPITEIIEYIKTVKDKHSEARAFFMILLCKMLLPTQSNVPTPQHVGMCSYIDEAKSYNWCKYICQNLKSKISTWKQREKQPSKIEGCALLLLMCLHQALKPQLALDGTQADPLINRYNDKTIAKLVKGMNLRQEKHIVIVGKFTIVFTLVAFQVVKHKDNIVKKPVQKPASRKQKVVPLPATKGPSKNLEVRTRTSTSLRFYHEVDKDEEGILLKPRSTASAQIIVALLLEYSPKVYQSVETRSQTLD
ncbi:hypothetical protein SORBI_3004G120233 [Sorghum bicolor]|uniref:Uncharacterized protein n=1 Tax=Sorghum bicolor TaxID=4558 RepID=A0A1Z5RM31_SORBI|nr:hypothetical protein SORBI_3004G120233 [Sorghum bicolor]